MFLRKDYHMTDCMGTAEKIEKQSLPTDFPSSSQEDWELGLRSLIEVGDGWKLPGWFSHRLPHLMDAGIVRILRDKLA